MKSMTAYAYVYKSRRSRTLQVTLRAINFKYLDVAIHNLPMENLLLEEKIKREVKKRIRRGKVEIYIFCKGAWTGEVNINEPALAKYFSQIKKMTKKYKLGLGISIGDILKLPGVVVTKDKKVDEAFILSGVKEGLSRLGEFKDKEGRIIRNAVVKNLRKLKENVNKVKRALPKRNIREESNKEDIDEELSLISFYISMVEKKIHSKEEMLKGKSLEFLGQEILRELNAASSKTKKKNIAGLIVEAKNYLERIREQAQNVE